MSRPTYAANIRVSNDPVHNAVQKSNQHLKVLKLLRMDRNSEFGTRSKTAELLQEKQQLKTVENSRGG